MRSNSILEERVGGTYYTGPLDAGIRAMRAEYGEFVQVKFTLVDGEPVWTAVEFRGTIPDSPNQWGCGGSEEEAWRYLIGTDFGPLDDTYEAEQYEVHQRKMLGLPDIAQTGKG